MNDVSLSVFCVAVLLIAHGKPRSEEWCKSKFSWKEDMNQLKLLEDCDITREQLTLKDLVERITDKTECIRFIDLHIAGTLMRRWKNADRKPLTGTAAVTFKNLLHEQNRH